MDYIKDSSVHFGLRLLTVNESNKIEYITGPISEYELEPGKNDDGILEIDAGRICSNGYVKPGKYRYNIELYKLYSDWPYRKTATGKTLDVTVSGIDIDKFNLSKKVDKISSADLANITTKQEGDTAKYDWKSLVNNVYEFSVDTPVTTNIEMDSAKAHIDTKHTDDTGTTSIDVIVFESITFKLSQNINGKEAYTYYTYSFVANNNNELASFPIAITAEGETNDGSNTSAGE